MAREHPGIPVIDVREVTAALEATGSSDPDVLFARREELLGKTRSMKSAATAEIAAGVVLSLTVVGAIIGMPAIRRGLALRKCVAASVEAIESAYSDYLTRAAEKRRHVR